MFGSGSDRGFGDLVEDHPFDRDVGLEGFQQMPGDGFALAVFIGGEQELVGVLEQALELGDLLPLVAVHDEQRLEVVVHVDAEPGPRLAPVLGRDLGRAVRHVADVADAGLDHVALAQVAGDGPGLGWGLDDDQLGAVAVTGHGPGAGGSGLAAAPAAFGRAGPGGRTRLRLRRVCPCWHALPVLASAPWPSG